MGRFKCDNCGTYVMITYKGGLCEECYDTSKEIEKMIKPKEETKMDELKVYTGKETIEALLEGETLDYKGCRYKIEGNELQVDGEQSYATMNFILKNEFTEVATPQVGDWVKVNFLDFTHEAQIEKITGDQYWANWDGNGVGYYNIPSRGVTYEILSPEQIAEYKREQVFAKVGRKHNEFRENDIVFLENTGTICMVTTKSNFNGNVGVKEINKPQKWNASVKQLEPIAFAENLVSLS